LIFAFATVQGGNLSYIKQGLGELPVGASVAGKGTAVRNPMVVAQATGSPAGTVVSGEIKLAVNA
jgi:hypothetical protein